MQEDQQSPQDRPLAATEPPGSTARPSDAQRRRDLVRQNMPVWFVPFYQRNFDFLVSSAQWFSNCGKQEAEDIVQKVFTNVIKNSGYPEAGKAKGYFVVGVRNAARDAAKKAHREQMRTTPLDESNDTVPDWHVENRFDLAESREAAQRILDQLPQRRREVIELLYYGADIAEIALDLDVAPTTVSSHRRNAAKSLRKTLPPEMYTDRTNPESSPPTKSEPNRGAENNE